MYFYKRNGCCKSKHFSLSTWKYSWRIRRHRTSELIVRGDTATLPVSWKQMLLKFMSFLYVILLYNLVCNYFM